MTDLRKAAEMALEVLEWVWGVEPIGTKEINAINALRKALAQPEQEPVAYACKDDVILAKHWTSDEPPSGWVSLYAAPTQPNKQDPVAWLDEEMDMAYTINEVADADGTDFIPLYTAPVSKPWVSLTDEEREYIWGITPIEDEDRFAFVLAVEAKLKEKNT